MKTFLLVFWLIAIIAKGQDSNQIEETTAVLCGNSTEDSCEAFNNTELPTTPAIVEITSEATKSPVPSKKTKTTTAKSVTKKAPPASNTTMPLHHQSGCTCDETKGGCEINCCCDVDCSSDQRAVFTHCLSISQAVDHDYCFPPQLLYRNNTEYQAVETDLGVLCVVHQNTLSSTDFVHVPVIRTVSAFEKKLGQRRYFSWPNPPPSLRLFDVDTSYGDGSPIWISDNITITHLEFPAATGSSTMCHSKVTLQYLEETETSCTTFVRTKTECLSSREMKFSVISSPRIFNFTQLQECTEDICLPVHHYICSDSCVEGLIPTPFFNESKNICHNLTESVEYKIYHNGSQGITDVKAFYVLRNISVHDDQLLRKRTKISYLWAGSTDQPVFIRSGKPGYEAGKPVISGKMILKNVTFNASRHSWISLGASGSTGYCVDRRNLLFKENVQTRCLIPVNGSCGQVQKQIWEQILGPVQRTEDLVISSYGDPRVEDKAAWVPVLTPDLSPSPVLTTAVEIIIVYSLVGSVVSPQAKIIGAYFNLLPSKVTCEVNHTVVLVETSVRFVDKTTPAMTKFAQPPVYEIKLPQDFFYPFLSDGCRVYFSMRIMWLVEFLLVLNLRCFYQ